MEKFFSKALLTILISVALYAIIYSTNKIQRDICDGQVITSFGIVRGCIEKGEI